MSRELRVFVTGGTGFVGAALIGRMLADGIPLTCMVRSAAARLPETVRYAVADLSTPFDLNDDLSRCDAVIHAAARVHLMTDDSSDPLSDYRKVNTEGTARLAEQAAAAGVRRFVYLSSIKVNGETSLPGHPFRPSDAPAPLDFYGVSKGEAEEALTHIARRTGMEVVIVRPVLVYGPGVGGNFRSLLGWTARGFPLPLGAVDNRRSLVGVANLVDFTVLCLRHPRAANETFLVSDGDDVSVARLIRLIGSFSGRKVLLPRVPVRLVRWAAALTGNGERAGRLLDSLQVTIDKNRSLLDWTPPRSLTEGLAETVAFYQQVERQRRPLADTSSKSVAREVG